MSNCAHNADKAGSIPAPAIGVYRGMWRGIHPWLDNNHDKGEPHSALVPRMGLTGFDDD